MPELCVIRWRSVTGRTGSRRTGLSPSQPSRTLSAAASGSQVEIGESRSSLPCSTSCIAQAPVIALVIEAMLQTVSSVIATPEPSFRSPKAAE